MVASSLSQAPAHPAGSADPRNPALPGVDAFRSKILPLRAQAEIKNRWLAERLTHLLPELMDREGLDLWIVIAREYNEDPVLMSLLPEPAMSARRRTILLFGRNHDGTVERLALDRYGHGEYYQPAWDPAQEEQYECLARIVRLRDPHAIGIDVSPTFATADGLTHSEYTHLTSVLGTSYVGRLRSAERLVVGWLERRTPSELTVYPGIVELGHALIAEAFSSRTLQPGITTTDDLVWWMRQKMLDLGVHAWFQPTVDLQAPELSYEKPGERPKAGTRRNLILPGDLLHCDVGFYYLGLATDQQQNAYVLRPEESEAPEGLRIALAEGNRLQDVHDEEMVRGRTGNEILKAALHRARGEGLHPTIYTHPIGLHGHAAGPTIGLWDRQGGVPGQGDYELFDDTCFAIELSVTRPIAEWDGQEVQMALEEDAVFAGGRLRWLSGRQTHLILIG